MKRIAEEIGWTPNVAAVALSAGKAGAIGLVIARPEESFTGERFFMRLIAGIERVLSSSSRNLVLRFAASLDEEIVTYRQWWSERRVDGVILTDPREDDPRFATLKELGLPAVVVGAQAGSPLPCVQVDDGAAMELLVDHFADLGRQRLAHVSGSPELIHTQNRRIAFERRCAERGVTALPPAPTDFSEEAGRRTTAALLAGAEPPDGIIYDNEVLTIGGLVAVSESSLSVPGDVALASFEDSPICRIARPQITSLVRDPAELGNHAAALLVEMVNGDEPDPRIEPVMELEVRGSTDPSR